MIAELHIQTKLREGITGLKRSYCTPPFKIADIREDKKDTTLQLMLMSSSPGVLDGDDYRIKIELDEGSSLSLSSQSYQRLFTMKEGASQQVDLRMQKGSSFSWLTHPVVPHQGSIFKSKNKLFLSDHCRLLWGEVLTCGRKGNGEEFQFSKYHNITEIFLNNDLIIKENLMIAPADSNVNALGQLENHTHQASLIYLDETADVKETKESVAFFLNTQTHITYGITNAQKNGLMIRILGFKAEQLHFCLKSIANIIKAQEKSLV